LFPVYLFRSPSQATTVLGTSVNHAKKMRVLLIDDDQPARSGLRFLLNEFLNTPLDIFEANGVESGIRAIGHHQPDLVFLDVEMQDGTGFDLLSKFKEVDFQLIFVTAHNHYAIRGFEFSAIDFLLKPIDEDHLQRALSRAKKIFDKQQMNNQLAVLSESWQALHRQDKKIALRDQENIYFVKVQEIIQCQANGAYTLFQLEGGKTIVVSKTLKEYDDLLSSFLFFRVHHSHLINLNKIKRFHKIDNYLTMQDGSEVPVSIRKKDDLLKVIEQF
jgi:two-component system, LytTR family, response regulator